MKAIKAAAMILALCTAQAVSQTIHMDDVDEFVGCYAIGKTDAGEPVIDCSKFIDWKILRATKGMAREGLKDITQSSSKHWIYRWNTLPKQEDRVYSVLASHDLRNLRFYVFYDFFGWQEQKNVLTVWRQTSKDSISYVCGQTEEVETYIGSALIEDITLFPDSSLLLAIKLAGEDANNFKFISGTKICEFGQIYQSGWNLNNPNVGQSAKNIVYDYSDLNYPYYQVVEIEKYITGRYQDFFEEYACYTIDSVKAKIIDLWELARK
ncbi:MAG: hypothetical protein JSU85_09020 [Candidatus Zixiibacteriota bacterium]|nr:MAG: hypothetical protein JSU85_09020 [candidate division Zixibacteria bacterium]